MKFFKTVPFLIFEYENSDFTLKDRNTGLSTFILKYLQKLWAFTVKDLLNIYSDFLLEQQDPAETLIVKKKQTGFYAEGLKSMGAFIVKR